MAKRARFVGQGKGQFPTILPIDAQDFLDFFGEGGKDVATPFDPKSKKVPEAVKRYAPQFVPILRPSETVSVKQRRPFGAQAADANRARRPIITRTPSERFETVGEAAARATGKTIDPRFTGGRDILPSAQFEETRSQTGDPGPRRFTRGSRVLDPRLQGTRVEREDRALKGQSQPAYLFGRATNSVYNPAWQIAYDEALVEFNKEIAERDKKITQREEQLKKRKEREDPEGAVGSGGFAPGTSLITAAQGQLTRGPSAAQSLLR